MQKRTVVIVVVMLIALVAAFFGYGYLLAQQQVEYADEIETRLGPNYLPPDLDMLNLTNQISAWQKAKARMEQTIEEPLPVPPDKFEELANLVREYPNLVNFGEGEIKFLAFLQKITDEVIDPALTINNDSEKKNELSNSINSFVSGTNAEDTGGLGEEFTGKVEKLNLDFKVFADQLTNLFSENPSETEFLAATKQIKDDVEILQSEVEMSLEGKIEKIKRIKALLGEVEREMMFTWQ